MFLFNKNKNKKVKNKNTIKKTAQDTIPYYKVHETYNIIETSKGIYTVSYRFQDINYHIANTDEQMVMFQKYCELLKSFEPSVQFQITINNININQESFARDKLIKEQGDHLDKYRKIMNDILLSKISKGKNSIVKEKYLTISLAADDVIKAFKKFESMRGGIEKRINEIGSSVELLTATERLEILHDIYNIGHEGQFLSECIIDGKNVKSFDYDTMRAMGLSTKDMIAPSSFLFKSDYFMVGEKFGRTLYLSNLSSELTDDFVTKLTDVEFNMITSMLFKTIPRDEGIKLANRQMVNIDSNIIEYHKRAAKSNYGKVFIPRTLEKAQEEAEKLLDDMTSRDQNMFFMTLVITHFADSKDELNSQTAVIKSTVGQSGCQARELKYQQEIGFTAALPLCNNLLYIDRCLTTEATGIFIPFTSQELNQKNGTYYGLNAVSQNIIMYDRMSGANYNGWILGTPGSGKSFSAKREIVNILLSKSADIFIIDPENEYWPMAKLLGGVNIEISTNSKNFLNPLDLDAMYGDIDESTGEASGNPVKAKAEFMLSLCEIVLGGRVGLSPAQISIIDRCVINIYREFEASNFEDKSKIPTLLDFQAELIKQAEIDPSAYDIALALEVYTKGTLDIFAHRTSENLDVNNRFIVYNILGVKGVLKTMAMEIILDTIWNKVCHNRRLNKETYIYIDEAHLLLSNTQSALFLESLYKRARKYFCSPTCITQNVSDIIENPIAKTMLSNSTFIQLLNQAPLDIISLSSLLNISETQISYIKNVGRGRGLIYTPSSIIPFDDEFPNDNELFKAMTTDPNDIKRFKEEDRMNKVQNTNILSDDEDDDDF